MPSWTAQVVRDDVYNPADEKLGSIKEFMIDMASGHVSYAVLSYGGFLGMGIVFSPCPGER
jgi:hypothetical protein